MTAAGIRQRADVFSGGSYGSSSDQRVHFGLGLAAKVDKIEIDWPSGVKQQIGALGVDRIITVEEGKPVSEKWRRHPAGWLGSILPPGAGRRPARQPARRRRYYMPGGRFGQTARS